MRPRHVQWLGFRPAWGSSLLITMKRKAEHTVFLKQRCSFCLQRAVSQYRNGRKSHPYLSKQKGDEPRRVWHAPGFLTASCGRVAKPGSFPKHNMSAIMLLSIPNQQACVCFPLSAKRRFSLSGGEKKKKICQAY